MNHSGLHGGASVYRAALYLSLGPAAGQGLGRFAYSLIVPAMQADLGWSYAIAGWMNTANAGGYLAGAIAAPLVIRRLGERRAYQIGFVGLVPVLALTALTDSISMLSVLRVMAGVSAGVMFVAGGALLVDMARRRASGGRAGLVLATFYGGVGLGMVISAAVIPPLLAALGTGGWHWAWAVLAAMAAAGALVSVPAAPREADGAREAVSQVAAPLRLFAPLLVAYLLVGAGVIGYLTFVFGWLSSLEGGWPVAMTFWITLGAAAVIVPPFWRRVMACATGGRAFGLLGLVTAVGAGLPLVFTALPGGLASAAMVGGSFFMITTATTAFVGRMPAHFERAGAIRAFTVAFALGQIAGPVLVGAVADAVGGLGVPLQIAVVLVFLGAVLGFAQRDLAS
ncbi:MAG: YbfB/YjiJ family MFS transporter [Bauldia sp.]|uniref:YbfB/YjiJ family MFS transporter n=1 Tax=Bauldia sp. TaxID=2575872 RepID=UPI001D8567EE|nr:YbfB/YjiJ family MFS transporter [Bauldia sp.]MCB1494342.1 YbfB/YjiJ family MFS transporter [Bauldia sp.]